MDLANKTRKSCEKKTLNAPVRLEFFGVSLPVPKFTLESFLWQRVQVDWNLRRDLS
jgi:hypothetical protein